MNLPWVFRSLLAVVTLTVSIKGTVEIDKQVRLITPEDDIGGGRIEVYREGQWGTICDENWSNEAAEVVCKELGFSGALLATKKAYSGQGSGPILLSNVVCEGTELSIVECSNDGWGEVGQCTHKDDAGVICIKDDLPEMVYRGCWIDNPLGNRILPVMYSNRRGNTDWHNIGLKVFLCAKDAINSGKDYNIFAVQFFGECYSDEGHPDYKRMKAGKEGCVDGVGELSHNAVYEFGPYYNLGCWRDRAGDRRTMTLLKNLRRQIDWYDMSKTVKACYDLAKKEGKRYFAVQFYGECWVSDDETFRKYGQATNCYEGTGEHWANYVYKIRV